MKTRYRQNLQNQTGKMLVSRKEVDEYVDNYFEQKKQELLDEVYLNVEAQTIAVCMTILEKDFNFKQLRQEKFAQAIHSMVVLCTLELSERRSEPRSAMSISNKHITLILSK